MNHTIVVMGLVTGLWASTAQADTPAFSYGACVTAEDREAAQAGANNEAFGASSIPLGPFYWASADRTFQQAMLVYWRFLDVDEQTRLTLTAPLAFDYCTEDSRMVSGPFAIYGVKRDADGLAGFVGPYFFRRDKTRTTDVLFPVWFRFSDEEGNNTQVLGPTFALDRAYGSVHGAFPVYAHADVGEGWLTLAPATLFVEAPSGSAQIVGPFARASSARGSVTVVPPLFMSASSSDASRAFTFAPALGWLSLSTPESSGTVLGPYFSFAGAAGKLSGIAGLYAAAERAGSQALVVPPLLYGEYATEGRTDRVLGPVAWTTDPAGYALYGPGVFVGRDRGGWDYEVLPLWARVKKGAGQGLLAGPYFSYGDDGGNESGILGLYAQGEIEDPEEYSGPVGLLSWVGMKSLRYRAVTGVWFDLETDEDVSITGRGPYANARFGDYRLRGVAPFALSGWGPEGGGFDLYPTLLTLHVFDDEEDLWYAAGTRWQKTKDEFHAHAPGTLLASFTPDTNFMHVPPLLFGFYVGEDVRVAGWGPFGAANMWGEKALWAFPGFLHRQSDNDGSYVTALFPVGGGWGDAEDQNFLIGPALHLEQGPMTTDLLAPVAFRHSEPNGHVLAAPGLLAFGDGPTRLSSDDSTMALGPLYARGHTHGGAAALAPVYAGAWHDEEGYWHAVPPLLFAAFGDEDGDGRVIAAHYAFDGPRGGDRGLFPLYATGHSTGRGPTPLTKKIADVLDLDLRRFAGASNFHYTFAPFFAQVGDDDVQSTLAFQTYLREGRDQRTLVSAPFLYFDRDGEDRAWVVPPALLGYGHDQDNEWLWMGNMGAQVNGDERWFGLAPLLLAAEDRDGAFVAGPGFYLGRGDDVRTLAVLQTLHIRNKAGDAQLLLSAPFWFGGEWDDMSFAWSPPAQYAHVRIADEAEFKLWGGAYHGRLERTQYAGLFPVLFTEQAEDHMSLRAPLLFAERDGEAMSLTLLQTEVEDDEDGLRVASHPFYYGARSPDGDTSDVFPLAASAFFHDVDPDGTIRDASFLGPLFSREGPASTERGFFGVWADGQGDDLAAGEAMLAPLAMVWPKSAYTGDGQPWRYKVRPGIVSATRDDGSRQTVIAGQTLFSRSPDAQTLVSIPLAFHQSHGGASTTVLPPLGFWQTNDPVRAVQTTIAPGMLLYDRRAPDRHEQVFGPSFELVDGDTTTDGIVPLYVRTEGPDLHNVFVPGAARIREPGLSVDAAGPLFVARNAEGARTEGALPLYAGHHAADGTFIEALAPAYVRWGDKHLGEERTVIPLLLSFVGKSDETTSLVGPGIWSRRSADSGETFVFPLFADIERERFSLRTVAGAYNEVTVGDLDVTVAPLYAEVKDSENETVLLGPLAWERPKEGDGYTFYLGPVFSYATLHDDHKRWRVLFGAFGYEREGSTEEVTLFWQKNRREL